MTALWLSGVADLFHSLVNKSHNLKGESCKKIGRKIFKPGRFLHGRGLLPLLLPFFVFIFIFIFYSVGDDAERQQQQLHMILQLQGKNKNKPGAIAGKRKKLIAWSAETPKFSVWWLKVQAIFSSFSWEGEVAAGGTGKGELQTEVSCQRKTH